MRNSYDYNHIVPIPKDAHTCKDNRIYIILKKKYYPELRYNMDDKLWIGKYASEGKMFPSTDFIAKYPEIYEAAAPDLFYKEDYKSVGLFGVSLSIGLNTGLYPILVNSFGIENANLLMDYSMSMIRNHSNVVTTMEMDLKERVIFLNKPYSDSWIGEKLDSIESGQEHRFFNDWLEQCVKNGIKEVWLCIDGCNSDYLGQNTELGEKGKAKSGKNRNIVGYMYAVSEDGTPVYGRQYNGGQVDSKELIEIITILREHNIVVKGIILDRGFCDISCFRLLDDCKYTYVIMLKENTSAYKHMVELYATKLKFSWEHSFGNGHYGVAEQTKVFSKYEKLSNVALIWDSANGLERSESLIEKVHKTIGEMESKLTDIQKPSVPKEFSDFVKILPAGAEEKSCPELAKASDVEVDSFTGINKELDEKNADISADDFTSNQVLNTESDVSITSDTNKNGSETPKEEPVPSNDIGAQSLESCPTSVQANTVGSENSGFEASTTVPEPTDKKTPDEPILRWKIEIDAEVLQKKIDTKGFYALACSEMDYTAQKIDSIYNIRDVSEKQNSRVKTQLGAKAPRGHSDKNIQSRFIASFSGSCIRNEFEKACDKLDLDVNKAIRELDHIKISLGVRDEYRVIHNHTENQRKLMKELDLQDSDFDFLATEEDKRYESKVHVSTHILPKHMKNENDDASESEIPILRVEGVPPNSAAKGKGSKKKTGSEVGVETTEEVVIKRKPGRPPKNPKPNDDGKPKRKRGRPPKNPKPIDNNVPKRKKGRPKKLEQEEMRIETNA